jgi:hypothetical protein
LGGVAPSFAQQSRVRRPSERSPASDRQADLPQRRHVPIVPLRGARECHCIYQFDTKAPAKVGAGVKEPTRVIMSATRSVSACAQSVQPDCSHTRAPCHRRCGHKDRVHGLRSGDSAPLGSAELRLARRALCHSGIRSLRSSSFLFFLFLSSQRPPHHFFYCLVREDDDAGRASAGRRP